MKLAGSSLLALLLSAPAAPQPDSLTQAPITSVTVFGDRARVTRVVRRDRWPDGRVLLPQLPAATDPDSVRLEISGAGAHLESVTVQRLSPEQMSEGQAAALLQALERLDRQLARAGAERELVTRLANVGTSEPAAEDEPAGEAVAELEPLRLRPAAWERAVRALDGERDRLVGRLRQLERSTASLTKERERLAEQAKALKSGGVVARARLRATGAAELRLTYDVTGARWRPAYDIHLDPRTERVTASLWAEVEQQTGEDWHDVEVTVSTAPPRVPVLAELPAWRIGERELFIPTSRVAAPPAPERPPTFQPAPTPASSAVTQALEARLSGSPIKANTKESLDADLIEGLPPSAPEPPHVATTPNTVVGYVFDQAGNPLSGVKVALSESRSKPRVTYSSPDGHFRFNAVYPGRYVLQGSAPKLSTVRQMFTVTGGPMSEFTLLMEVSGSTEEVKVMEKEPLVVTSSGQPRTDLRLPGLGGVDPSAPQARELLSLAPPPLPGAGAAAIDHPLAAAAGGHQLRFRAVARETVRSEPGVRRVPLGRHDFAVKAERHLYPAVAPVAHILAELRSPAPQPLPGGPVSLSVGADPAGQTTLALVVPGQPFRLPLGLDRALRPARRITQKTYTQGLVRRREVTRYDVVTEISNPHAWPVRVVAHDQLPVSSDGSVEVALLEATPRPKHDAKTGALRFVLTIPARATRAVRFAYTLSRPRGHRLVQ